MVCSGIKKAGYFGVVGGISASCSHDCGLTAVQAFGTHREP
jgi:hypothetical protein